MIRKSKVRYCTLFCPKYCAAPDCGAATSSAPAIERATAPARNERRIVLILSAPAPLPRPPVRPPTAAPTRKTPAAPGGTGAPRNPRNRAAPSGPAPAPPRGGAARRWEPAPPPDARPCRARARHGRASGGGAGSQRRAAPPRGGAGAGPLGAARLRGFRGAPVPPGAAGVLRVGAAVGGRTGGRGRGAGAERMRTMRRSFRAGAAALSIAGALLVAAPQSGAAQYFGQNKVQYSTFDFRSIETEHFDVYYYPPSAPRRWMRRVS